MTTQHTLTPWTFDQEADNSTDFWIFQANGPTRVAVECSEADAAFIVRACNAHDELVAALESIADGFAMQRAGKLAGEYSLGDLVHEYGRIARAALAKVTK